MNINSYAKINLTLRIINKLKNRMHNIETVSVLVGLNDKINITESKKDKVIFTGKFKSKINKSKNTILDTLDVLRKLKLINKFYSVVVKKNIPVFAGLGGGTSNSFSLVKYLLKKKKINEKYICFIEKKIGSDFRLFFNNCSYQKKLKKVDKINHKLKYYFVLLYPNINCKTKEIYKKVKKFSKPSNYSGFKKVDKKKFFDAIIKDKNDLQKIIEKKHPKIKNIINSIYSQNGCVFSRMTGSGSVCYGVFNSKKNAEFAMNYLKRKYTKFWCVITKTI